MHGSISSPVFYLKPRVPRKPDMLKSALTHLISHHRKCPRTLHGPLQGMYTITTTSITTNTITNTTIKLRRK